MLITLAKTKNISKFRNGSFLIFEIFKKKVKLKRANLLGCDIKIVIINLNLLAFPVKLDITYMVKF
ncbi:MAG: hypothetical protein CMK52_01905 [Proteobacteria bacterium]|nr:hypothetical protein [Pseudomonadota bacterium]